ncbi:MAG: hypothetical protein QM541_13190 [Flavobacterium sp.]|nr:hypothetical protein [Flavobacterium sp.]
MDKILLKLVGLFKGLFNSQGIDYARMMTIVETKLTMDKRRVYMNWKQNQQKKESNNHLKGVLLVYAVMSLFIAIMLLAIPSLMLGMILVHSYILFMMAMTLITDFSSVLLDTTDNQVILPKPISSKTLFMARLVHILIYLLQFNIAIAVLPLGVAFFKFGVLAGLFMIITTLLTALMAVFITYLLYLVIIRFSSESKVKDIVTYFQIFMTVLFTVGFQVLPKIINLNQFKQTFELHWYSYLLPPVWMASAIEAVANFNFDALHLTMIAVAFVVPLFTFWFMNKFLAPSFAKKLGALSNGNTEKRDASKVVIQQEKNPLSKICAHLFCSSPVEKSGFQITWKMTSRDKSFKLQFYPSMAYIAVFIFIFVFKNGQDLSDTWSKMSSKSIFLVFLYVPLMTINSSLTIVAFNENYLASWVYHSMPIHKPGELVAGMAKSLFVKFFIPVYTLLCVFCFYVWGIGVLDDALFALVNNLFCFLIFANLSNHYLPFSRQPNTQQQTGKFITAILQLLIVGLTIAIHYVLIRIQLSWLLWALTPVLAIASWKLIRRLQNLKWYQISI